ncbi:TIR domain-containing adapter molecule 1 [Pelodytes ibericus]
MSNCSLLHVCDLGDICLIISHIPSEQLTLFKHQLKHQRPGKDIHKLLHALILLTQNQKPEALKILESLPHCHTAQHISETVINRRMVDKNGVLSFPATSDQNILTTSDQIYKLMVQENLCKGIEQTNTCQRNDFSVPHTLHSFGIPIPQHPSMSSLSSNLQISMSPTLVCSEESYAQEFNNIHTMQQEGSTSHVEINNTINVSPEVGECPLVDSDANKNRNNEPCQSTEHFTSIHTPVNRAEYVTSNENQSKITDTTTYNIPNHKHPHTESTSLPTITMSNPHIPFIPPVSSTAASSQTLPSRDQCSVSPSDQFSFPRFFSFVILHAREDLENACRVNEILSSLGIGEGTTFSEEFEVPGTSPLNCMQNAIEDSAYIILLLTEFFVNRWTRFQSNTALMNSIEDPSKVGTVIPFLPQLNRLSRNRIPLALKSVIPLDETSSVFQKMVRNTFKPAVVQRQKRLWSIIQEQKAREQKRQEQLLEASLKSMNIQKEFYAQTLPTCPIKQTSPEPTFPMVPTQLMQGPNFYWNLPQQSSPEGQLSHYPVNGQPPIIQITNAGNVQIGNNNCMTVQHAANEYCDENRENYYGCENKQEAL